MTTPSHRVSKSRSLKLGPEVVKTLKSHTVSNITPQIHLTLLPACVALGLVPSPPHTADTRDPQWDHAIMDPIFIPETPPGMRDGRVARKRRAETSETKRVRGV